MATFSVIIPLYNKEKSISETLQSALNQTYKNFEIVVVNDGSKDKSLEVAQAFSDNRIRIIDKKNGGVSSARNEGIKAAKYDYLVFLDGDDIWLPWHLQTLLDLINKYDDPLIGGYCTKIIKSRNPSVTYEQNISVNSNRLINNYFKEALAPDILLSSSSFAVKKKCFDDAGLFNESLSYGEDVELWYRIFRKYKLVASDVVTAMYRLYTENRSNKNIMPLSKRFHDFNFEQASKDEKKYLGKLAWLVVMDYWMQGAYKISLKTFWRYRKRSSYMISYFLKLLKKKMIK